MILFIWPAYCASIRYPMIWWSSQKSFISRAFVVVFQGNILLFGLTGFTLNKVLLFGVEKSGVGAEVASLPSNTAEVHLLTHSILFLCAYLKDYVFFLWLAVFPALWFRPTICRANKAVTYCEGMDLMYSTRYNILKSSADGLANWPNFGQTITVYI